MCWKTKEKKKGLQNGVNNESKEIARWKKNEWERIGEWTINKEWKILDKTIWQWMPREILNIIKERMKNE